MHVIFLIDMISAAAFRVFKLDIADRSLRPGTAHITPTVVVHLAHITLTYRIVHMEINATDARITHAAVQKLDDILNILKVFHPITPQ